MLAVRTQFVLLVLFGLLDFSASAQASSTQKHVKPKPAVKQELPAPQADPPAPVPLTPAQMPAAPPQVSYNNGSLTIVAQNSTLGDILREVHAQTGAVVDISGNANERVISHLGPGRPRDVLAQLLNGSEFNYVMLGSPSDAGMVEHLILSPKLAEQEPQQAQAATAPNEANPFPRLQPPAQTAQDMSEDEDDSNDTDAQDDQNAAATGQPAAGQAPGQNPNQPAIKTPEQLLQELQRQQQIQQQQQGAAPGAENPQAPNQK